MTDVSQTSNPDVIRITRADLDHPHVDDLLKRQASLRGEGGITRDRRGAWYYQNWFVLMIAGALGAAAAWAIVEPYFDDMLYLQGPVQSAEVDPDAIMVDPSQPQREMELERIGFVQVKEQKIILVNGSRAVRPDGGFEKLDVRMIQKGAEIGVYLEGIENPQNPKEVMWYAPFVALNPAPQPAKMAGLKLDQIAARHTAAAILLFPLCAAFVGLAVGAADALICRLLRRGLLAGSIGLIAGFLGGLVSVFLAGLIYAPLSAMAFRHSGTSAAGLDAWGFALQVVARASAWGVAGMAMGLGQGLALRSPRLSLYGFLGGIIGGLMGGMLFDPIDLLWLRGDRVGADWSRMIGLIVIGAFVGAMIGVVELLARDAWLRMTEGPLAGKEFLIFKDAMHIGSSPRSDIYLFNDAEVAKNHAVIRTAGDTYELEPHSRDWLVALNGRPVQRSRLRHGDRITIGRTSFLFQTRRGN